MHLCHARHYSQEDMCIIGKEEEEEHLILPISVTSEAIWGGGANVNFYVIRFPRTESSKFCVAASISPN